MKCPKCGKEIYGGAKEMSEHIHYCDEIVERVSGGRTEDRAELKKLILNLKLACQLRTFPNNRSFAVEQGVILNRVGKLLELIARFLDDVFFAGKGRKREFRKIVKCYEELYDLYWEHDMKTEAGG